MHTIDIAHDDAFPEMKSLAFWGGLQKKKLSYNSLELTKDIMKSIGYILIEPLFPLASATRFCHRGLLAGVLEPE